MFNFTYSRGDFLNKFHEEIIKKSSDTIKSIFNNKSQKIKKSINMYLGS